MRSSRLGRERQRLLSEKLAEAAVRFSKRSHSGSVAASQGENWTGCARTHWQQYSARWVGLGVGRVLP